MGALKEVAMLKRSWVTVLLALALAGCASIELGAPIRIDRLVALTPKVSARSDVLLALGEPSGTGGMRFNPEVGRRAVWFYEHIDAGASTQKITILLVFFDADRYDGHYWFGENVTVRKGR
jgi:hypothetical protein